MATQPTHQHPHPDFSPLPLLGNAHVQTLLGSLLPGPGLAHPTQEHQVDLPDGDRLMLHDSVPDSWKPGDRITLLVHGLGGSHRSRHIQRLARELLPAGLRVVRVDLRGCGRGLPLARRCYHGGCSDDVRAALATIQSWSPTSPVILVGVSLGGNIVLKLAGEAGKHPMPNLEGVAALAPPIDLVRCCALLAKPSCRLYERYFLRDLIREVRLRRDHFPDLPPLTFPRRMTIRLFDELYTAPLWGFADALDYYRRASALPLLSSIEVPTLILTARDDPFIAVEPFEEVTLPYHVQIRILNHGGHLGFLGRDGAGGFRWAERRLVEWVTGFRREGRTG
jgi:predicted alpha/beta-fold hydrolase